MPMVLIYRDSISTLGLFIANQFQRWVLIVHYSILTANLFIKNILFNDGLESLFRRYIDSVYSSFSGL
jgi:hypothetical protein